MNYYLFERAAQIGAHVVMGALYVSVLDTNLALIKEAVGQNEDD